MLTQKVDLKGNQLYNLCFNVAYIVLCICTRAKFKTSMKLLSSRVDAEMLAKVDLKIILQLMSGLSSQFSCTSATPSANKDTGKFPVETCSKQFNKNFHTKSKHSVLLMGNDICTSVFQIQEKECGSLFANSTLLSFL